AVAGTSYPNRARGRNARAAGRGASARATRPPIRRPTTGPHRAAMLASVASAAVRGVESYLVHVEVNLSSGLPTFAVVGLPEGAVREGRERVTAALQNAGRPVPPRRVVVNLSPADVPKSGSAFDLPIALGLLA